MAENQTEKSKRELFLERLKTKHPEWEYSDDEALFGQMDEDYADYDKQIGDYRKRDEEMDALVRNHPTAARWITDMAKGDNPIVAMIEHVGADGVTELMNDPEKREAIAEADKRYVERLAEEERLNEAYNSNLAESQKMREGYDAQYGEEVVDAALAVIDQMCKDAIMGKVTPETMEMALKVVNHDADVANARSEGEVAGRNAKIDEKLKKRTGGDGLPAMAGSSATPNEVKRNLNIFDYAEAAQ